MHASTPSHSPTSTDRKTSRAALQLLRSSLQLPFLLCSCLAVSKLSVCVRAPFAILCVCVVCGSGPQTHPPLSHCYCLVSAWRGELRGVLHVFVYVHVARV